MEKESGKTMYEDVIGLARLEAELLGDLLELEAGELLDLRYRGRR